MSSVEDSLCTWQVLDLYQNSLLLQPGGAVAESRNLLLPFAFCCLLIG